MADILLVPGAFHGGWCWRPLAERLGRLGHRAEPLTLSGLGERRHLLSPAIDLETHIQDILNAVRYRDLKKVVMVMHSYGGMPGTGAADRAPDRIAAMVWLDAFIPEDGCSALDLRDRHSDTIPLAAPVGAALAAPPAAAFNVEGDDGRWLEPLLTAQPLATVTQPISLSGAWRAVPVKHYYRAERYRAGHLDAMAAAAEADPAWQVTRRDMAHDMMVTEPEWTAAAILAALPR